MSICFDSWLLILFLMGIKSLSLHHEDERPNGRSPMLERAFIDSREDGIYLVLSPFLKYLDTRDQQISSTARRLSHDFMGGYLGHSLVKKGYWRFTRPLGKNGFDSFESRGSDDGVLKRWYYHWDLMHEYVCLSGRLINSRTINTLLSYKMVWIVPHGIHGTSMNHVSMVTSKAWA